MANTSMTLGPHWEAFIKGEVESGRYASASEVVRAALRLLEERKARVKALQDALIAGEESGEPQPLDFEALKAQKRAEFGKAET